MSKQYLPGAPVAVVASAADMYATPAAHTTTAPCQARVGPPSLNTAGWGRARSVASTPAVHAAAPTLRCAHFTAGRTGSGKRDNTPSRAKAAPWSSERERDANHFVE